MEQYYIVIQEGQTAGPYSLNALEILRNQKKITGETLVCKEGTEEWVPYSELLFSLASLQNQNMKGETQPRLSVPKQGPKTPEGTAAILKIIGSLVLVLGIILLIFSIKEKEVMTGVIFLGVGILSTVSCFWMARVVELLSDIANKK